MYRSTTTSRQHPHFFTMLQYFLLHFLHHRFPRVICRGRSYLWYEVTKSDIKLSLRRQSGAELHIFSSLSIIDSFCEQVIWIACVHGAVWLSMITVQLTAVYMLQSSNMLYQCTDLQWVFQFTAVYVGHSLTLSWANSWLLRGLSFQRALLSPMPPTF